MTCFSTFLGVLTAFLNKTLLYKYNISNFNKKKENSSQNVTFSSFFSYFHLLVEENQNNTFIISAIIIFPKIAKITYLYASSLILRQYIYFSLKPHVTLFSMFFEDLLLLKENHLFFEKIYDFTRKVTFFNNFLLISMF